MKKLLSTLLAAFCALPLLAQSNIVFTDENGTEIADGTIVTANKPVTDDFGEMLIPSGIYVKNQSAEDAGVRINYTVKTLDNGTMQICFPMSCVSKSTTGSFNTDNGLMSANEKRDLQTEWLPQAYGNCIVTYQIEMMKQTSVFPPKYESQGMGATITVNYIYADPAAINGVTDNKHAAASAYYDAAGARQAQPRHGLNIVRKADGKVVKQWIH